MSCRTTRNPNPRRASWPKPTPPWFRHRYVDEIECIGCMYCAQIARNTFFIEDDAGRARAFARQPVRKACA